MSNYNPIDTTGVILADTADVLAQVEAEFKTAFGSDLVVTPDTPQGVLIAQETQARSSVIDNNALVANQINPNQAGGTFLDAICAFLGLQRAPATYTLVTGVTLGGVQGTVIPSGTLAYTSAQDQFALQTEVTIPVGGTITGDFAAVQSGAVPCAIGALSHIEPSTAVLGWESVTNPNAGVLGQDQQSDAELKQVRLNTLASQGVSSALAIQSGVSAVINETSMAFRENYNNVPMGMIIGIQSGTTLSGTVWSLSTTGSITVDTTALAYIASLQTAPAAAINPWPTAKYATKGNVTLSGLSTQTNGDWPGAMTAGDIVLAKGQTTASQNGLWVVAAGAWTRHSYMAAGASLLGSNDGIGMIPHSIWACVAGGSDLDIATALLENKSEGCGYNGSVSVDVVEPASGQTYNVLFDRPTLVNVGVIANLSQGTNTSNLTQTAVQAMLDFTTGQIAGEAGWIVGAPASPYDLGAAIVSEQNGVRVRGVQVATVPDLVYQNTEIELALNQQAILDLSYVTVNVIP